MQLWCSKSAFISTDAGRVWDGLRLQGSNLPLSMPCSMHCKGLPKRSWHKRLCILCGRPLSPLQCWKVSWWAWEPQELLWTGTLVSHDACR